MKKLAVVLAIASMIGIGSSPARAENPAADDDANRNPAAADVDSAQRDAQQKADDMADDKRPEQYPADNSGRNQRDQSDASLTAGDQSNAKADVDITQAIRRAVTSDDSLSVNAKNVKIITAGGVVTLRGPVKTEQERANIAAKAQAVTGVTRVNNQLEVAAE